MNTRQVQGWWVVGAGMIAVVLVLLAFMYSVGGAPVSDDQLGAKSRKIVPQEYDCKVGSCPCHCNSASTGETITFSTEGFGFTSCVTTTRELSDDLWEACGNACEEYGEFMGCDGNGGYYDRPLETPAPTPNCTRTGRSCTP